MAARRPQQGKHSTSSCLLELPLKQSVCPHTILLKVEPRKRGGRHLSLEELRLPCKSGGGARLHGPGGAPVVVGDSDRAQAGRPGRARRLGRHVARLRLVILQLSLFSVLQRRVRLQRRQADQRSRLPPTCAISSTCLRAGGSYLFRRVGQNVWPMMRAERSWTSSCDFSFLKYP